MANEFRLGLLKDRADAIRDDLYKARKMLEKAEAEHRELTDEERAFVDPVIKEARDIADSRQRTREEDETKAMLRREFGDFTGPLGGSSSGDKTRRLSFSGMGSKVAKQMAPDGMKALAPSGATIVSQEFKPDPVTQGQPALSLLDVIPVVPHAITEFAYMRQTVRTNNAAVVAEGAAKPTSIYTVVKVPNSLVVVAHLSEGIPRFWLIDQVSLETFVSNELDYGLRLAVEAKLLTDINATSGIQAQAYATSVLATLRKSLTKLEVSGHTPGSLVLHPTDWEGVELALSTTNARRAPGAAVRPGQPAAVRRARGGLQRPGRRCGSCVGDRAVALDSDTQGIAVTWTETSNADDWSKNQIRARWEGRFGTSVLSPLGECAGRRRRGVGKPRSCRASVQRRGGNAAHLRHAAQKARYI